jgi:hypothetical protein
VTDQPAETMAAPGPADVRLDPRLLTYQRMCGLVGDKMVRFTLLGGGCYIDCAECGQGITAARPTSPLQFCADVLRHYVNVHGVSLSGKETT